MLDCVVIGAGIAGLSAALELMDAGKDVAVLEARSRVGGRLENMKLDDGQVAELGGQWINPDHECMLSLVKDYRLTLVDPPAGDTVIVSRGQATRMAADGEPKYSAFEMSDLGQGLVRFTHLVDMVENDHEWLRKHEAWLEQLIVRWITANLRTPGGREAFAELLAEAIHEADLGSLSLREAIAEVNSSLSLESFVALSGELKQVRVAEGIHSVCAAMADELDGRVHLDTPVVSIEQSGRCVRVVTRDGKTVEASHAIVTLPPWLLPEVQFTPALSEWREETIHRVPQGSTIKAFLVYPEPWWRAEGLSGRMGLDSVHLRVAFDTSDEDAGYGILGGLFDGGDADVLRSSPQNVRERVFVQAVQKAFGSKTAIPIAYVERDWFAEEYTRGCHVPHFAPGKWSIDGPQLAEPENRIHFAGAEYATKFNSYMEGAVVSAKKAVKEILG